MEDGEDERRKDDARGKADELREAATARREAAAARREAAAARAEELRGAAAARAEELREAAAAKREAAAARAEELRGAAAQRAEGLRHSAAVRGSELGRSAAERGNELRRHMRNMDVPWARSAPARMARETILQFGLAPLMGLYMRLRIHGRERFDEIPPPVILVANHSSHLDTPTILRALPLKWRQRTAVAAAADYFYKKRAVANAVALIFNTVPILRGGGGGVGEGGFDHVDRLIQQRWNLLIFPEGTRSREGRLGRLRSGAAVIAQRHDIPIVPISLHGTHEAMPPGQSWPKRVRGFFSRRHQVDVRFGAPITAGPDERPSQVMDRVRRSLDELRAADGLPPSGEPPAAGAADGPERARRLAATAETVKRSA